MSYAFEALLNQVPTYLVNGKYFLLILCSFVIAFVNTGMQQERRPSVKVKLLFSCLYHFCCRVHIHNTTQHSFSHLVCSISCIDPTYTKCNFSYFLLDLDGYLSFGVREVENCSRRIFWRWWSAFSQSDRLLISLCLAFSSSLFVVTLLLCSLQKRDHRNLFLIELPIVNKDNNLRFPICSKSYKTVHM